MSLVVVASLHGSPGASSLAVALSACLPPAVLIEADASGGVLAARCGLSREPGVVTLAADRAARGSDGLAAHAQVLASGVPVLPCSESAEHTSALLRAAGDDLASRLADARCTSVVDVGRLGIGGAVDPLLERAAVFLVVSRPTVDALAVLAARLPALRRYRPRVALVGDHPYSSVDVASGLDVDVVSPVAFDAKAVDAMWTGRGQRALPRSAFARSVSALADELRADLSPAVLEDVLS